MVAVSVGFLVVLNKLAKQTIASQSWRQQQQYVIVSRAHKPSMTIQLGNFVAAKTSICIIC